MGRKKIQISRITDERNRQVMPITNPGESPVEQEGDSIFIGHPDKWQTVLLEAELPYF
jgi:hypothetical protein